MKKLFALFSMFMLCLCGMGAETETTLLEAYKMYVTGSNGQSGSTAELILCMKNRNAINTWSCTLVLPAGVTFNKVERYDLDGRYPSGYSPEIYSTLKDNNSVALSCQGATDVTFSGVDGGVALITVDIASTVAAGEYEVLVKDSRLVESNNSIHPYDETKFTWTIEENAVTYGTITFDLGGAPGEYAPITVPVGDAIVAPDDPEWEGYTFKGWLPQIPELMPDGGITVVAQWELNKYQVFIETEPKDGVTISNMNPEHGSSVTITVNDVPDMVFETLLINQEDVTKQMKDGTYVIDKVTGDIWVWAFFRPTAEIIVPTQEYTPFSSSEDLDFTNSELKAYIASGFNKATNQVILVRAKEVPAFTGVLLIGVPGETYKVPYNKSNSYYYSIFVPCIQGGYVSANEGTAGAVAYYNYIFDVVNEEPGFYPVSSYPAEVYLPAQSAYLTLPADFVTAGVKISMMIEDDVIDGIADVQLNAEQSAIYDLQGRRVSKASKGIFIVNGRKVAFK